VKRAGASALLLACALCAWSLAQTKNEFQFAIIGDRTGRAVPGVYEAVWREVEKEQPAFAINVGDTIEGGDDAKAESQWRELQPLWTRPFHLTPGNHDIFSAASQRIYERQTKHPASYSFDYEQSHFTILDNSRTEDLDGVQLEFLRQDLEKNKTKSPKLVFFHRPFWIPYVMFKSGDFELHRIAKQYGVTAIVNGHAHLFMHMKHDGITYMVVGSSGGAMDRGRRPGAGFREGWFYHHVNARVTGSVVKFTIKEVNAPLGEGRQFPADAWDRTGPNSTM
jgi:3',5'-cyclic-AMP phosphodiesterase